MEVLIACEESQTVTSAFRALGHDAYSCDILPCSGGHPEWHIEGDVSNWLASAAWDIVIAFPPCTHLSRAGARWMPAKIADGRQQTAIDFFLKFTRLTCRWAIENPAGVMSKQYRKPDQVVQPYQFGDAFEKHTCLWLSGLPELQHTNILPKPDRLVLSSGRSMPPWYNLPPGPDRSRLRSITFPGIAAAMADQWTRYVQNNP